MEDEVLLKDFLLHMTGFAKSILSAVEHQQEQIDALGAAVRSECGLEDMPPAAMKFAVAQREVAALEKLFRL